MPPHSASPKLPKRLRRIWRFVRSGKPPWLYETRDRIAYPALVTSRIAALFSFVALCLNLVVAYVAITSLKLNVTTAEQARAAAKIQTELNGRIADAAKLQAEASMETARTARESLVNGQRAWIAPSLARSDAPSLEKPLKVVLQYQNPGREPALETLFDADVFVSEVEQDQTGQIKERILDFQNACKLQWKPGLTRTVFPSSGGIGGYSYNLSKTLAASEVDQGVLDGTKVVVLNGCFNYKTGQSNHRSTFCFFYRHGQTEASSWNFCDTGNDAD